MNTATSTCNDLPGTEEISYFDPDLYLLGILRRAVAAEQNVVVSLPEVGEIRVLTTRGDYFSDLPADRMQQFCCQPAERYSVRKLTEREIAAVLETTRHGRNIDELMWHASLCASKGRLLRGCRRDDVVLLKHWPNLTRLAVTPNAVRIAALLTRYPTSVSLAYRLLKIPVDELNEFYSAAHAAGWAVAVNRKPEISDATELKPHRHRGLLTLILSRIAGS